MASSQEKQQKSRYTEPDPRYSMFYPKTKDGLLIDYPQLQKFKEFNELRKEELLFVFFFYCKSSPLAGIDNQYRRAEKAVSHSFSNTGTQEAAQFKKCNFPDRIIVAGEKMRIFEPGPRIRAKKLIEKILSDYEKIVGGTDVDDEENSDMNKKKNYVELTKIVANALPGLISQAEESFGVTEIGSEEELEDGEDSAIELFVGQK